MPHHNYQCSALNLKVKIAVLVACSNIPIAFNDRLSPAIRTLFPDSKVAHSARTKATCILNIAVAPHLISVLVMHMTCHAFSLAIDGTNDCELQKMNPITVRIYDISVSKVVTHFLEMCTTTSATAKAIFNAMDHKLVSLLDEGNPWLRCTSFGVDNTSVNIGSRNSLKTRIKIKNPSVHISGCNCHILHNAAQKASEMFVDGTNFDVEELVIDRYYWFDKSTKRKNELQSFCTFCDISYKSLVKHITTRWLSLEIAIDRALKQLPGFLCQMIAHKYNLSDSKQLWKILWQKCTCYFTKLPCQLSHMQINSFSVRNPCFTY